MPETKFCLPACVVYAYIVSPPLKLRPYGGIEMDVLLCIIMDVLLLLLLFFTPVLSSQGEKKLCYAKKIFKLEWSLLLLLLHKTVVE